jgi:general secretion pathway protein J
MEILIAIFIFSIIVTTLFGSFTTIFSNAEIIDTDTSAYDMGKSCMNRIVNDLQALHVTRASEYKIPDIDDPPDPYRIVGDSHQAGDTLFGRLRFASLAHLPFQKSHTLGIAEVVYYIQAEDDQRFTLRRKDNLFPYPEFEENNMDPILCRNVQSLSFAYYNSDLEEFDNWDSESPDVDRATPSAVGIKLSFGEENAPLFFETKIALPMFREKIEQ